MILRLGTALSSPATSPSIPYGKYNPAYNFTPKYSTRER